ncbi:serine dehydratase beta chain [Lactobacillus corticis]|uniref:L-serine ammonia-lyase n=1 Tax=Lactobacillus corticis TaxID=2201249 RepID=A0A916QIX1_9LACO|nr:serine dehydratase beta chain [Lactobacillus corticis]GFZ26328.1 L-serine dehydratase beta subunit [Lactobacillus corticis]
MAGNYRSVFDIIGPIMIGPSSSHTAGAVAIGKAGRTIFNGQPKRVVVHYYESFAQTHQGHGTDYAIAAGIMNFPADDDRVPIARQLAKEAGIDIRFVEEAGPSPIGHPNTAVLNLSDGQQQVEVAACSVGGGVIEVRQIKLYDLTIKPTGPLPIILYPVKTTDERREIKGLQLTEFLRMHAPFKQNVVVENQAWRIFEFDLINYLHAGTKKHLLGNYPGIICI